MERPYDEYKPGIVLLRQHKNKILLGDTLVIHREKAKHSNQPAIMPFAQLAKSDFVNMTHDWKEVLSKMLTYFKADKSIKYFVMDNNHEINVEKNIEINNIPIYKGLFELATKHKILNNFYYTDNNLDSTDSIYGIKSKPYPYFLGWNVQNNLEITPRSFTKHFLFLNRITKPHRRWIFGSLIASGIIDQCHWSYDAHNPKSQFYKCLGPSEQEVGHEDLTYSINSYYPDSFCNIVAETNFNWSPEFTQFEGGFGKGNTFITEKTEKCFSAGMPFIIVGTPFFLKRLRKLGFKTFGKFWDESYDDIEDTEGRLKAIFKVVETISHYKHSKLAELYHKMIPILKHNQELNNWYWIQGMNSSNLRYPGHTNLDVTTHYFDLKGNSLLPQNTFI